MSYGPTPDVPGGTYFFTVRLQDPCSQLLVDQIDLLRQAVRVTLQRYPFEICAAVVLPATLHMMWELPMGDANHGIRWRMIKSTFSRHLPDSSEGARTSQAKARRREKGIWQRRYWDHLIRDQADYALHEHLIIHAPTTAALVKQPGDWAYSSVHLRGIGQRKFKGVPMPETRTVRSSGALVF